MQQYKDKLFLTPEEPAKLFAILPGNKLVVFPLSKFNTIDFAAMRQEQDPTHYFEFSQVYGLKNAQDVRNAFGS